MDKVSNCVFDSVDNASSSIPKPNIPGKMIDTVALEIQLEIDCVPSVPWERRSNSEADEYYMYIFDKRGEVKTQQTVNINGNCVLVDKSNINIIIGYLSRRPCNLIHSMSLACFLLVCAYLHP